VSKFNELVQRVIKWSEGIDLYNQSTEMQQVSKAFEEIAELIAAIDDGNLHEIKDAIGDILVCTSNARYLHDGRKISKKPSIIGCHVHELISSLCDDLMHSHYLKVTAILGGICREYKTTLDECFEIAVDVIEKRKLLMDNGKAVKWENMTDGQRDQWRVLNENN